MPSDHRRQFFGEPKEHSRIKLRIVEKYLAPWAAKVGSRAREVLIVDGFAGKGVYDDGTPGSPKLILDQARSAIADGRHYRITCLFVEAEPANARALAKLCDEYPDVRPELITGDFWARTNDVENAVKGKRCLLLIDPFGIKGLNTAKLARIANSAEKCDLIVTFMDKAIPRIRAQWSDAIDAVIGTEPTDSSEAQAFADRMSAAGRFLPGGRFPVRQSFDSAKEYELIVFSHHPDAYALWNDSMTREAVRQRTAQRPKSAPAAQQMLGGFPEAAEAAQEADDSHDAANEILRWSATQQAKRFTRKQMIEYFVVNRFCVYHTSVLRQALSLLEQEGRVRRHKQAKGKIDTDPWEVIDARPL